MGNARGHTHTHLDHPIGRLGVRTADDFHVGTIAGACGGVTTIIDFSLQDRGESLLKARDRRLGEIEPNSIIDYSFHTIVTDVNPNSIKEVESLVESGFLSDTVLFLLQARMQSGTILSSAQSPPPITFPALTEAHFTFELLLEKNE